MDPMVKKELSLKRLATTVASVVGILSSPALVPLASPAAAAYAARPPMAALPGQATNLVLTGPVVVQLVVADAAAKHLAANDFLGVQAAYYAYDGATSTYWAAAEVVPAPWSYQAEVESQDDGGYTIFHEPPHGSWVATDDGMGGQGGVICARYHVSIPSAVLATWHWPSGTCTPPPNSSPGRLLLTYFGNAARAWWAGAAAISAKQGGYWLAAAKALEAAVAAKAPGTTGYADAAGQLVQLSKLPDAMQTSTQQKEDSALTVSLDAFFGSDGLYGISAPSRTTKAFAATLGLEAGLGTLSLVADPRLGKMPAGLGDAVVTCPVLAGVTAGSVFGCKVEEFDYFIVGTIRSDYAMTYFGYFVNNSAVFECKADGLSTAEQLAAKKMGGGCAP
ncbi:MAG TPA: hypothetical protein VME46_06570 [Acidimicrobiales bacterium]|nr:hypothetical protein [Acidimicrobiales bacterium]